MRANLVSAINEKEGLLLKMVHRACVDTLVNKEQQKKATVKCDNVVGESVVNKMSLVDQLFRCFMLASLLKKGLSGINGANHRHDLVRGWMMEYAKGQWTDKKKNKIIKFLEKMNKNILVKDLVCGTSGNAV